MSKELIIPVAPAARKKTVQEPGRLKRLFLIEKLNNPVGYVLLLLFTSAIAAGIVKYGASFAILSLVGMLAIPIVYALVVYPSIGIIIFLTLAYLIMWFLRLGVNFPLGTLMDGMEALFILGLFIQQKRKPNWQVFRGSISTMILIWLCYNFIEVANPSAESRMAWVYTVRSVGVIMVTYFIFVYNIRTKQLIRIILKLWLGLAFFAAAYAFKQEHIGFFPFEESYLHSDPRIAFLLFINGVWRKFSIFSDPVSFSYSMVVASLLCIGLMTGPISTVKKIILGCMASFYTLNMLYSGTRGAYVLLPAALLLLAILKYNKKVLIMAIAGGTMFAVVIFMPAYNQTLYRFQSAFKPSEDASFNVRKMNQKRIQPYILKHPLGGGLGSTGEWGKRFAPNSYLANFPPDSGYVRVAVEMGWVGLFLFCSLLFTILKTGINNYFRIRDPELKSYCLAMTLIIFAFHIGNYPQEALVQYPSNVYFYLSTALIVVLMRIDNEQNELLYGRI